MVGRHPYGPTCGNMRNIRRCEDYSFIGRSPTLRHVSDVLHQDCFQTQGNLLLTSCLGQYILRKSYFAYKCCMLCFVVQHGSGPVMSNFLILIHCLGIPCTLGTAMEALKEQNLPVTQIAMSYVLLFVSNGVLMLWFQQGLHSKWYNYLGMSVCDAFATYCTVSAMAYTSVISWSVLSPTGVILCIPLSHFVLGTRHRLLHYLGVILTVMGIALLIVFERSGGSSGSNALRGDGLILIGAFLYSANSIWVEKVLRAGAPQYELLWAMSGFGLSLAIAGIFLLGENHAQFAPTNREGLLRGGAIAAQFALYSCMPVVVHWSGATVMQLSLLGAAVWAVPFKYIFFDGLGPHWWVFALSAALSILGIAVYTLTGDVNDKNVAYEILQENSFAQYRDHGLDGSSGSDGEIELSAYEDIHSPRDTAE